MTRVALTIFTLTSLNCFADECLYDHNAFKQMYIEITKQHSKTEYLENGQSLKIYIGDKHVIVKHYGCEHYGTEIKYFESTDKPLTNKELYEKAINAVEQFGQGRIDSKKLRDLLLSGKVEKLDAHTHLVPYPYMDEFAIIFGKEPGEPLIEIQFYN